MTKNKEKKKDEFVEEFSAVYNGVETKFKVLPPTLQQQRDSMKVRNRAFYDAVESGAYLKTQLVDIMTKRNLWNKDKQSAYVMLEQQILDGQKRLQEGGFKLNDAKELAFEIQDWRNELVVMRLPESNLTNETAEGQADNASFNYLVSVCVVYNDTDNADQYAFNGVDDYLNRSSEEVAMKSARSMMSLLYGVRSDFAKELPENEFLVEYGFMNNELQLINKDGQLINEDGELLDDDLLPIEKEVEVERKPFLDDDGKDIICDIVGDIEEIKPIKKTKKTTSKKVVKKEVTTSDE